MTKWRRWRLGWTRKRKWRRGTRRVAVCGGVGGWVGGGGEGGEMMVDNDVGHISKKMRKPSAGYKGNQDNNEPLGCEPRTCIGRERKGLRETHL